MVLLLLNRIGSLGVRDSVVIVTGRQKREGSSVKVVKAECNSGVTWVVSGVGRIWDVVVT